MEGCPKQPADARPFIVATYHEDADGRLAPANVARCPVGSDADKCATTRHVWRSRKTGPEHPLLVVRCRRHGGFFTIYPPGHVPYGRRPLVKLAPDGSSPNVEQQGASRFLGTCMDAAIDAAEGVAWARDFPGGTDRWWSTQRRRLRRACLVTGVDPQLAPVLRGRVAEALDVDGGLLVGLACEVVVADGYRARGRAVTAVLEQLPSAWAAFWRLAEAGWMVGLWRRPMYAAGSTRLLPTPFRSAVARSPPCGTAWPTTTNEFGTC